MSESPVAPVDAGQRQWTFKQIMLLVLAEVIAFSKKAGLWSAQTSMRLLRSGASLTRKAAIRTATYIAANHPVRRSTHLRVRRQLEKFEVQVIASVRGIECREKRTRAILALARTAYEIGRDNEAFLKAILEELRVEPYWLRKQQRVFAAAQFACATAGLAALSGHADIGRDAYLCGQTYNGKVVGVDRKIGLATVFADVAALLEAGYDRVAWLSTAMELACGIEDATERFGAVNFVARKMVMDHIPPCDDRVVDRRFAVDVSAMAKITVIKVAEKPAEPEADLEFKLTA